MSSLLRPAAVLALALAVAAPVRAQTAPLRTLVYAVTMSSRTVNDELTSGFTADGRAVTSGSATVSRSSSAGESGTLTVEVVAAPPDGGLVVDAALAGRNVQQPRIRVAILADGRISAAPSAPLSVEAARLLPLLSRGLVAGKEIDPGVAWTMPVPPPARGSVAYRVTHVDGALATLALTSSLAVGGPQGYDENDEGVVVYDTVRLCPTRYEIVTHGRHQPAPEQFVRSEGRLTASLLRDSFAQP